jgi:hypothetical protein
MRSDIVFDALQTKNRFELCHQTFRAIRLLHKNNTRIEDTANDALMRLAGAEQVSGKPEDAAVLSLETVQVPSEVCLVQD